MDVLSFSLIADQIKREINHKCRLSFSQTRILLFFYTNNNQALPMGKLATNLNISLSTLSRQLQQSQTKTFIAVNRSNRNSSKKVNLNEAGIAKLNQLRIAMTEIKTKLLASLDEEEKANFLTVLNLLARKINLEGHH